MNKGKDIHISFPEGFLEVVDKWKALSGSSTRSEFLRRAVRVYITKLKGRIK